MELSLLMTNSYCPSLVDQLLYQKASLLNRMNFVKLRGNCTAKIHISDEKFDELKSDFLNKIDKAVSKFDIPQKWSIIGTTLVLIMWLCQTGQWRSKDQRRCR